MSKMTPRASNNHSNWLVDPVDRDALAAFTGYVSDLIKNTTGPTEDYFEVYELYIDFADRLEILGQDAETILALVCELDEEHTKAQLHRLNCHVMRYLSGMESCYAACGACTKCPGAYEDMPGTNLVLTDTSQKNTEGTRHACCPTGCSCSKTIDAREPN